MSAPVPEPGQPGYAYSRVDAAWARGYVDPGFLRFASTRDREFSTSRRVWRGTTAPWALPEQPVDLDQLDLEVGGQRSTLAAFLDQAQSDSIVVLHKGKVVYERYLHGVRQQDLHINASLSKSIVGLVALRLLDEGLLSRDAALSRYVPELAGTAFGDATVQDLLHMGTQMRFAGRPFNKEREAAFFFLVTGITPRPAGYAGPSTVLQHLGTARAEGPPGQIFRYDNSNTEALAEAMRRVTRTSISDLVSETVWQGIGASEDAHFTLDLSGNEIACGRFSSTLRDLAKVGEMLRCGGAADGRQVLPERMVAGLTDVPEGPATDVVGRDEELGGGPTIGYHDFWWIPNDGHGSFEARGRHGQRLYVAPGQELVIAHHGSHLISPVIPVPEFGKVFRQIGDHLHS
jgi:CubicO group peptidase (beta-lactamase class C family)